jgi:hypothetical protein
MIFMREKKNELFNRILKANIGSYPQAVLMRIFAEGDWKTLLHDTTLMEFSFGLQKGSLENKFFESDESAIEWLLENSHAEMY